MAYKVGKIPFLANGRALGMGDSDRLRQDAGRRHYRPHPRRDIIGANASELISKPWWRWSSPAARKTLARICHAHPTLSEVVYEAALACDKRPLHF